MNRKKKVSGRALRIPAGLGIGTLISILITIGGAALTAWLTVSERIGEESIGYAAMVILVAASALGALAAAFLTKRLRLQVCMMTGGCYYLSLIAMTALFFGGQFEGMGTSAVMVLIGCVIIAFWPSKIGETTRKKGRVYR